MAKRHDVVRHDAGPGLGPAGAIPIALAALLFAVTAGFAEILDGVVTREGLTLFDPALRAAAQTWRTAWGDTIMVTLTMLGDVQPVLGVVAATLAWLAWQRAWRPAFYLLACVGTAEAVVTALKIGLRIPRPITFLGGADGFSFPSGHAAIAVVLYGFLTVLAFHGLAVRWRAPAVAAAMMFAGAIALSRFYLGVHWLSDVAGSVTLGAAWLTVFGVLYVRGGAVPVRPVGLLAAAAAALMLVGGLHIYTAHAAKMRNYGALASASARVEGPASAWLA